MNRSHLYATTGYSLKKSAFRNTLVPWKVGLYTEAPTTVSEVKDKVTGQSLSGNYYSWLNRLLLDPLLKRISSFTRSTARSPAFEGGEGSAAQGEP